MESMTKAPHGNPVTRLCWLTGRALRRVTTPPISRPDTDTALAEWREEAAEPYESAMISARLVGGEVPTRLLDAFQVAERAIETAAHIWSLSVIELTRRRCPTPLAAKAEARRAIDRLRQLACLLPPDPRVLPDGLREIWDMLERRSLTAKEMAHELGAGHEAEAVRKQVARLNDRGFKVANLRGTGYYRPDAPVSEAVVL